MRSGSNRVSGAVGVVVLVACAAAAALFSPEWILFLLTLALAKGMIVVGVALLLRGGLISFGHGLYYAAGAYTVGFAMQQGALREAMVLLPMAAAVGGVLAAVIGLILQRYRGIFFAMLTLAFSMVAYTALLKFYQLTGGTDGIGVSGYTVLGYEPGREATRLSGYLLTVAATVLVLYLTARILASPLGHFLLAVRFNEVRTAYLGASVPHTIHAVYTYSGAVAGLGGALVALNVEHVAPEFAYWTTSADFVFVAVLGGGASVYAPFAGSIVFEVVKNYALKLSPYTWQLTLGTILLLIIFFLPQGLWTLMTTLRSLRERWPRFWRR